MAERQKYFKTEKEEKRIFGSAIEREKALAAVRRELGKILAEAKNPVTPAGSDPERRKAVEAVVPLLITTFLTENGEGGLRQKAEQFPTKEEHFGRNDRMPLESLPQTPEEAEKWAWDDGVAADCHQFTSPDKTNRKYVSPDGQSEAIFTSDGDLVTAPEDCGSYNLADPNNDPVGHFYKDVLPWILWGNDELDSTDIEQRMHAFVVDGGVNAVKKRIVPRPGQEAPEEAKGLRAVSGTEPGERKRLPERLYGEQLYRAIDHRKTDEVRDLLASGGDVNSLRTENPVLKIVDYENIYPLEKACKTSCEMADLLLEAGADAGVVDPYIGATPLIYALSENYEERFALALRLIDAGARIDQVDDNGRCALNRAAILYDTDGEKARQDELELMKYLLHACDLEEVMERSGDNPLVEAARFNNVPVMRYILEEQLIDINRKSSGYTALMKAVLANCREACALLLEYGADPAPVSPTGKTAADYAAKRGDPQILELFR